MRRFALSRQLLRQIIIWSALLVTLVTGAVFWATMEQTREQQIAQMALLAKQRVQVGRSFFSKQNTPPQPLPAYSWRPIQRVETTHNYCNDISSGPTKLRQTYADCSNAFTLA